MSCDPRGQPR